MLHMSEPFISSEIAYRQEKIRASFANAGARRRYRQQRRRARGNWLALPHPTHRLPLISR
jgi:hypothetical protein